MIIIIMIIIIFIIIMIIIMIIMIINIIIFIMIIIGGFCDLQRIYERIYIYLLLIWSFLFPCLGYMLSAVPLPSRTDSGDNADTLN